MQHIDLTAAKAAKASDRKALAILAYDNGCADPTAANWRGIADLMRLAIPATKSKPADIGESESKFAPWADYPIPHNASGKRLGKSPVVIVTFADGETVRAPAVSLPGKPLNIGRALRVARSYYHGRFVSRCNSYGYAVSSVCDSEFVDTIPVPAVVSAVCEASGAAFDPVACSAAISSQAIPCPVVADCAPCPVAPSETISPVAPFAARFLQSSSLASPIAGLPVAPSCVIRIAA